MVHAHIHSLPTHSASHTHTLCLSLTHTLPVSLSFSFHQIHSLAICLTLTVSLSFSFPSSLSICISLFLYHSDSLCIPVSLSPFFHTLLISLFSFLFFLVIFFPTLSLSVSASRHPLSQAGVAILGTIVPVSLINHLTAHMHSNSIICHCLFSSWWLCVVLTAVDFCNLPRTPVLA